MKRPDRWIDARGYVRLKRPTAMVRCGFVYEHRVVMEKVLGRPLLRSEDVHHRNEMRSDNRPENLKLTRRGPHVAYHNHIAPKRKRGVPSTATVRTTRTAERRANRRRAASMRAVWQKRRSESKVPTFAPTSG